jgi:cation transport regulator ChaB
MPTDEDDLPGTLKRSPKKAQRTYAKTLDSAEETYDDTSRAHRAAWSAVKHSFEKKGDHWEAKDEKGASDPQAKQSGRQALENPKPTYGGVDVEGNTREELYARARSAGVKGASKMKKAELAEALARREG